jgi:tRNA-splicing ligase RtcB
MPDAHSGYGLPIGGVLAVENSVIPYGVGVDIGCRMCMSIFDIPPADLSGKQSFFSRELNDATLFGAGNEFSEYTHHPVLENPLFRELSILRPLRDRAAKQLGSSGSGNHFVEFGILRIPEYSQKLAVPAGQYVALLSHSGSRALGANIANHYTKLAATKRKLSEEARNLAWFTLDEEPGVEYWKAMTLAGDYASACHEIIHRKIAQRLGQNPLAVVENHHNFAWKEKFQERELIVHRKGATPAGAGVLGIIPGSMTTDGFIVVGKGDENSINSASHGAGRVMSRTKAMATITEQQFKDELERTGVKLMGGGLDEAPFAYKDIEKVMNAQQGLVNILGRFTPKIVKMDAAVHRSRKRGQRRT